METVTIPRSAAVTWNTTRVPMETPTGILDSYTMPVTYGGRTYHVVEQHDGYAVALDVADGSTVWLEVEDGRSQRL